ncbi:MAG TPA: hypothetical protein VFE87_01415 [Candidatus Paceibacterota bacterium]|nr:hypothetical protein [Candidatus Paceibacterota bacterium]
MAKSSHLTFSKEHGPPDNRHIDSYRQKSDSPDVEKTDHTPADKAEDVMVNVVKEH